MLLSDSDEDTSEKSTDEDHQRLALEELTDVHFKFEVREVCLLLYSKIRSSSDSGGAEVLSQQFKVQFYIEYL